MKIFIDCRAVPRLDGEFHHWSASIGYYKPDKITSEHVPNNTPLDIVLCFDMYSFPSVSFSDLLDGDFLPAFFWLS